MEVVLLHTPLFWKLPNNALVETHFNVSRHPPPRLPQSYQQEVPTYQTSKLNLNQKTKAKGTPMLPSQQGRHGLRLLAPTPVKYRIFNSKHIKNI